MAREFASGTLGQRAGRQRTLGSFTRVLFTVLHAHTHAVGIRVVTIAPGGFETPMVATVDPEMLVRSWRVYP